MIKRCFNLTMNHRTILRYEFKLSINVNQKNCRSWASFIKFDQPEKVEDNYRVKIIFTFIDFIESIEDSQPGLSSEKLFEDLKITKSHSIGRLDLKDINFTKQKSEILGLRLKHWILTKSFIVL